MAKIFAPDGEDIVPRAQFDDALNTIFGGQFKYKYDELQETKADNMATALKKKLVQKVCRLRDQLDDGHAGGPEEEDVTANMKGYAADIKRDLHAKGMFN